MRAFHSEYKIREALMVVLKLRRKLAFCKTLLADNLSFFQLITNPNPHCPSNQWVRDIWLSPSTKVGPWESVWAIVQSTILRFQKCTGRAPSILPLLFCFSVSLLFMIWKINSSFFYPLATYIVFVLYFSDSLPKSRYTAGNRWGTERWNFVSTAQLSGSKPLLDLSQSQSFNFFDCVCNGFWRSDLWRGFWFDNLDSCGWLNTDFSLTIKGVGRGPRGPWPSQQSRPANKQKKETDHTHRTLAQHFASPNLGRRPLIASSTELIFVQAREFSHFAFKKGQKQFQMPIFFMVVLKSF